MYHDPDQDLDQLWWSLVEKYQNINCPAEVRFTGMWASKTHLATAPVYYHNYLIGEMTASQLLRYIKDVVLAGLDLDGKALVSSPVVGEYMKSRLFEPGSVNSWKVWIEKATEEPLNPRWFISQLGDVV